MNHSRRSSRVRTGQVASSAEVEQSLQPLIQQYGVAIVQRDMAQALMMKALIDRARATGIPYTPPPPPVPGRFDPVRRLQIKPRSATPFQAPIYIYPAAPPEGLNPYPGALVQAEDTVRFTSLPVNYEVGGIPLPAAELFKWGTQSPGFPAPSPVVAVDMVVHGMNRNGLPHGAVIAFLYANGAYIRPAFNDTGDRRTSPGPRPWADINRSQVTHVWRNGTALA